jgi:GWxTD domain-containing protein
MTSRALLVPLLAATVAASAQAQSPAQRDSIEGFRATLGTIADSLVLRALEAEMIERARGDRDNAWLHVELGFVAYRLGEITGSNLHYDDAAGEFEWAAELEPEWPYPWYGLGLAELAMGEQPFIALENVRQILGLDYLSKASGAFTRATEVDPSFAVAVVDLAETALTQRIRPRLETALNAVRRATRSGAAADPAVQLARGRVERAVGDPDSALAAFDAYLTLGGDGGVGNLERARTLFYLGRPEEAAGAYFAGAEPPTSAEGTALYWEDLSWVALPDELEAFDAVPAAERPAWLREFWRRRDVEGGRSHGERLTEHYRRYFYALEHYALLSRHRRYDVTHPYRNEQQTFDDRGIIYLRHGEPTDRATYAAPGVDPNESWLYQRPDGDLLFHFVAADDVQDYRLVESLLDILGMAERLRLQTDAIDFDPSDHLEGLLLSRGRLNEAYRHTAAWRAAGRGSLVAGDRDTGERSIDIGTNTDSYPLAFRDPVGAYAQRYVVADQNGPGGALLVAFAVPASSLESEEVGVAVAYRVEVRVGVVGPHGVVASVDTVLAYRAPRTLGPGEYVSDYVMLRVPVGRHRARIVLGQPWRNVGDQTALDTLTVPDFADGDLHVTDLIVGREGSGLRWEWADESVSLTPLRSYPAGSTLDVYYEIHGLGDATAYRTRLEVRREGGRSVFGWIARLFGGGDPPIALTFDGVAPVGPVRAFRQIDIGALEPGTYRLRVVVEDLERGRRVEREEILEVTEP